MKEEEKEAKRLIRLFNLHERLALKCVDEILKVLHAGDDVTRAKYEAIRKIIEQY